MSYHLAMLRRSGKVMIDGGREQVRDLKRRSVRYRPGSLPHLAIFGIRRGGSTLLADMIAAERGMWFRPIFR